MATNPSSIIRSPMRLGDFEFTDFASPTTVKSGDRQSLKVHKVISGRRYVQAMGSDPANYVWSGTFYGDKAYDNKARLKAMSNGKRYALVFDAVNVDVVIDNIEWEDSYASVGYTITCVVLNVNAAGGSAKSDLQLVQADVTAAVEAAPVLSVEGLNTTVPNPKFSTITNPLQTAMSALNLKGASPLDALNQLQTAQSVATMVMNEAHGVVDAFGDLGRVTSINAARSALTRLTGAYDTLGSVAKVDAFAGRAIQTIIGS